MAQGNPIAAPSTLSQPSRKGKKAWRKNVDITAIQSGLEELRTAQITHGGLLSEKDADDVFATDTVGDETITQKQHEGKKLLKAEEILALRSKVPGLEGRKRKIEDVAQSGGSRKKVKDASYVSHKGLQRLRAIADGKMEGLPVEEAAATHDPWADAVEDQDPRFDFLDNAQPKKTREPRTLKHAPSSLAVNGKSQRNVLVPNAGKSYNPLVGDWSALLEREGAAAVETETKRLEAEANAAEKEAQALTEAAKVEAAEKDEYATDYDSAWESEWDGIRSGGEQEVFTLKQKQRKTQVERNKIKARKEREAKEVHERKMRDRDMQERRIGQIAKEVSARDRLRRSHVRSLPEGDDSSASDDGNDDVRIRRTRFGKYTVPEAPLEVVLPEELEDSLRRLKPEGNLMQDRYRNLLISGKVEVRKRQGLQKQAKNTRSEKWSYKDWKLR